MRAFQSAFRFLPVIILVIFLSCSSDDDNSITEPHVPLHVSSAVYPEKMVLLSDYFYTFQVSLVGSDIEATVLCAIYNSVNTELGIFTLRDDAGYFPIEGEVDFASAYSGDVVAGDGIYVRKVKSSFAVSEDEYRAVFKVTSIDSTVDTTFEYSINVYENDAPVINVPNPPLDTLASGFDAFDINMLVTDPQGREDIAEVKFELLLGGAPLGTSYFLDDPDLDSIFTHHFEPSFAAGLMSSIYDFRFSAEDSLGEITYLPDITVYIENTKPILLNAMTDIDSIFIVPDPGDISYVLITVEVSDPQTLADIDSVKINYERPTQGWTFGYPMADNGLEWNLDLYLQGLPYLGDEIAGDGIFTFTKPYTTNDSTTVEPGIHKFHIHCIDRVGQSADSVTVELEIQ